MSFLNSVLSSLNDGTTAISIPQVKPSKTVNSDKTSTPVSAKRKADDDLKGFNTSKTPKVVTGKSNDYSNSPSLVSSRSKAIEPAKAARKDVIATAKISAPLPAPPKVPPKKGSFADVMARAAQNQTAKPVGTITHKPKEKMSAKKELALQKELALKKKKGLPLGPQSAPVSKPGSPAPTKGRSDSKSTSKESKPVSYHGTSKARPQPAYQGTSKPKPQISYTGTMKPGSQVAKRKAYDSEPEHSRSKAPTKPRRPEYYSDAGSEEEYGSEDQYDYLSDDYSDMDAGFDEVEEEDEEAARLAKKEDIAEQRMLDELKRQKEERKRRALAGREREREYRRG